MVGQRARARARVRARVGIKEGVGGVWTRTDE